MKLILQGYSGKMGEVVYNYLKTKGHEFVQLLDKDNNKINYTRVKESEAIIDFSMPTSSLTLFECALKYKKPMIIGTTGFKDEEINYIKNKSKEAGIGVYLVYNFLSSINFLNKVIKQLSVDSDSIYVIDRHNKSKKDQPSGTSKLLVKGVDKNKVHFISERLDFYAYEHKVEINNEFETIEIIHKCYNKLGYAKGVEKALRKINGFVGTRVILR